MEFLILILIMFIFLFVSTRITRKGQEKQRELREEAISLGNNVVTSSGFFGRIVDIDGDAVTLESPSGDETVWMRSAIMSQMNIPLSIEDEEESHNTESELDSPSTGDIFPNDEESSDPSDKQGSAWK
ncbi:preprotein translocase subunit YajC [Arcanobacterium phocae]|uniref:preprotein translocase subunit YajC n=1 Tax=Arcanobacterium phocae TaxID=131112 RepID=UPI001C0EC313|nr:preprotein translocase subunit YajC [Arcanobacterium phocae]